MKQFLYRLFLLSLTLALLAGCAGSSANQTATAPAAQLRPLELRRRLLRKP